MTQSRNRTRWQVAIGGPVMSYRVVFIDRSLPVLRARLQSWIETHHDRLALLHAGFDVNRVLPAFDRMAPQISGKANVSEVSFQPGDRSFYLTITRLLPDAKALKIASLIVSKE